MFFQPFLDSLTTNELNRAFRIVLITGEIERKMLRTKLILKFSFSAFKLNFYSIFTLLFLLELFIIMGLLLKHK